MKWYRVAAEQGWPSAQANVGYSYEHGQGLPVDREEAIRWYTLAALKAEIDASTDTPDATMDKNHTQLYLFGQAGFKEYSSDGFILPIVLMSARFGRYCLTAHILLCHGNSAGDAKERG